MNYLKGVKLTLIFTLFVFPVLYAQENAEVIFDDSPRARDIDHPEWFKESFLDLPDDLKVALDAGKKGIAIYFGQKHCAYCKALMDKVIKKPDINSYFERNFDVISLDIWGEREVNLLDGDTLTEREFSILEDTNFTPSLIFYNEKGEQIYRMRGFYSPYRFRAMLKYMVEGFYKNETFRQYIARAQTFEKMDEEELNEHPLFSNFLPILDRRQHSANKPLAVIFEQANCHACDQLHTKPLYSDDNYNLLKGFEVHQINGEIDQPVITPAGNKMTSKQWADELGIHYYPSVVFFNELGHEIMRVESLVKLYRLGGVLEYIVSDGYKKFATYQRWRRYTPRKSN